MNQPVPIQIVDPPAAASILAIAAHPDDIESWCGGTLARAVDAGAEVRLLLVTSGELGSNDPTATSPEVATQREAEAQAAAAVLGLHAVAFLRQPDGNVENTLALRRELVEWIRTWRPDVIFTHDPEHPLPPYLAHRDHRTVGRAVLDAVYPLARDRLAFPEHETRGLMPHAVAQVWLFAGSIADRYVDITLGLDRKIGARLEHVSQTPDVSALGPSWRSRAAQFGEPAGLAAAETFTVLALT
jgi:LmbE family N-acetylglucosaminyl deacetylase